MQTRYFDLRDTKGQQKEIEDKIGAAAKILRVFFLKNCISSQLTYPFFPL